MLKGWWKDPVESMIEHDCVSTFKTGVIFLRSECSSPFLKAQISNFFSQFSPFNVVENKEDSKFSIQIINTKAHIQGQFKTSEKSDLFLLLELAVTDPINSFDFGFWVQSVSKFLFQKHLLRSQQSLQQYALPAPYLLLSALPPSSYALLSLSSQFLSSFFLLNLNENLESEEISIHLVRIISHIFRTYNISIESSTTYPVVRIEAKVKVQQGREARLKVGLRFNENNANRNKMLVVESSGCVWDDVLYKSEVKIKEVMEVVGGEFVMRGWLQKIGKEGWQIKKQKEQDVDSTKSVEGNGSMDAAVVGQKDKSGEGSNGDTPREEVWKGVRLYDVEKGEKPDFLEKQMKEQEERQQEDDEDSHWEDIQEI